MSVILFPEAAGDPALAGGKAAALARLTGVAPIPEWFVITAAGFGGDGVLAELRGELASAIARLGSGPFAVRSSGMGEDGAAHAHAGQFLTELTVAATDVPTAAWRVHRSGMSASVAAYRARHGIYGESGGIAVIVQRQLAPAAAGVAFSADPVTGRRARVVISATRGLADRLVSGEVDGSTIYVDRASGEILGGGGDDEVLNAEQIGQIAALASSCEARSGCPQDIEWAIEDGTLYLLQSRPITTLQSNSADDPVLTIWDNSNIVESYPGLVSPLTFSFARHVYAHVYRVLLGVLGVRAATLSRHRAVLENLLGRVDGHVYYNLLNWYRVLVMLPGFALNRRFMEQMMGLGEALPDDVAAALAPPPASGMARVRAWLAVAGVGGMLALRAATLPHMIRGFERRLARALDGRSVPADLTLSRLAAEYRALESALLENWDAPLVNDLVCMIAFGASRRVLERWVGADGLALHNEVMIGQGDIVSAEPARRIRELAELARAQAGAVEHLRNGDRAALSPALGAGIESYLARFGDRCPEELKLESIPLTADPSPLLLAIAASAASPGGARAAATRIDADERLRALFPDRPLHRRVAAWLLGWAKARVRDRENLRFERTRVFGRVRGIVLAMGGRLHDAGVLADPRDVFLLTIDELLGAIEGGAASYDLSGLVALRRHEQDGFAAATPPERVTMRGAVVLAVRDATPQPAPHDPSLQRGGTGCSPGRVRAVARVIRDPRSQSVAPGEILVARHTDPGWIALFANVSGIVVERGSLLSHSAIVAREMGVPCVVGLKGALDWIVDGETIEIDGTAGVVTRCPE